jgi:NitT/TauT family transport system ATP-binding protein
VSASTAPLEHEHPPETVPALDVRSLEVVYRVRGVDRQVLRDVTFEIPRGASYGLVGESGCGKSTAAMACVRYLASNGRVSGGSIHIDGRDLLGLSGADLRELRSKTVSMVYQDPSRALNPSIRAGRQVAEVFEVAGVSGGEAMERAEGMLRKVQIADPASVLQRYPHQLSGGMAQRVALARALVNDPKILILDEPLGKLDSLTRITMQAELVSLWQRKGFTTLLVTHDAEEALVLANRVIVFSDRPARVKADIRVDRPYPRHRGDPYLADLRRQILGLLGLDATW